MLTEAVYMLTLASMGSDRLGDFILKRGMNVWFFTDAAMTRAFELIEQYPNHPMDLADASLLSAGKGFGCEVSFALYLPIRQDSRV